jgi:hypothetical protein
MRLLEIQPSTQPLPASLTVAVGDVLRFAASGGRVREGTAVEVMGIFVQGVLGTDGRALTPQGTPNTVLFRAVEPGRASIEVFVGDPFHSPARVETSVIVEGR